MKYATLSAAFAASFLSFITAGGAADNAHLDAPLASEERLLGSNDDEARFLTYQPFIRQIAASGFVADSLEASLANEGVPAAAMIEARRALATSIDFDRDVRPGDAFYVRFEQGFTAEGASIGVGRMLLVELHTNAKGKIAIYRFRGTDNAERFWLASGRAACPPPMRLPLEDVTVASGFGLRSDPFGQAASRMVSIGKPSVLVGKPSLVAGSKHLKGDPQRASSPGMARAASVAKNMTRINATALPRLERSLFMHEGVDLVALSGTPVYAAADGIIVGAAPNGGYGNWIQIKHRDNLATVYAHLLAFAPAIEPGKSVERGDLIGFAGSTGRSTGAHLHFEIHVDNKPVDPMNYQEIRGQELRGLDLERFNHQLSQDVSMKRKGFQEASDSPAANPQNARPLASRAAQ